MIWYVQIRTQIYYQNLRHMLLAIAQLFSFLMMILYLAIPAAMLTALISLSVIVDSHTSSQQRVLYQAVYFLLLCCVIRVQKPAILGQEYAHYLASLPIANWRKRSVSTLLTLLAGNVLLLVPWWLMIYIPNWATFVAQLYFPLFAISLLLITWLSVNRHTFAWFGLFCTPILLFLLADRVTISATWLNVIWCCLLLFEAFVQPFASWTLAMAKVQRYWHIRWLAIKDKPVNALSRLLLGVLVLGLMGVLQHKLGQVANDNLQLLSIWLFALLIGSYQFDNEMFNRTYHYYLKSLLMPVRIRFWLDSLPILLSAQMVSVTLVLYLHFSLNALLFCPMLALISSVCVSRYQQNFFIVPSLCLVGAMAVIS